MSIRIMIIAVALIVIGSIVLVYLHTDRVTSGKTTPAAHSDSIS